MEVKREEMTDEKWAEMRKIAQENVCAECGGDLQIHTVPEAATIRVGCSNREHHGWVERETYTQAYRRGKELHPAIRDAVEKHLLPKDDLGRAMNLLALRYPDSIKDQATASLFLMDCARLDIDPLISPAEAVPVAFTSRHRVGNKVEEKVTVQMIITADGWLSMAARGCKDDWVGPPRTMRLEEFLAAQPENKGRPAEELAAIAAGIKKSEAGDPEAWFYMAVGRRRGGDEVVAPGYFTHADHQRAKNHKLPAATQPGNQARIRAIKKWVRQVFPECRQSMIQLTDEWYRRSDGIKSAQEYIDAEYRIIEIEGEDKDEGGEEKDATGRGAGAGEGAAVSSPTKAGDKKPKKIGGAAGAGGKTPDDVTEEDVPDLTALQRICFHFYNMQPPELWKELGYRSQLDVNEPAWQCWLKIKAVKEDREE